jgi:hypothetical protein
MERAGTYRPGGCRRSARRAQAGERRTAQPHSRRRRRQQSRALHCRRACREVVHTRRVRVCHRTASSSHRGDVVGQREVFEEGEGAAWSIQLGIAAGHASTSLQPAGATRGRRVLTLWSRCARGRVCRMNRGVSCRPHPSSATARAPPHHLPRREHLTNPAVLHLVQHTRRVSGFVSTCILVALVSELTRRVSPPPENGASRPSNVTIVSHRCPALGPATPYRPVLLPHVPCV